MPTEDTVAHDRTGKVSFDDIYTRPDPRAFYATLQQFDYRIPDLALPHFERLIGEYRTETGIATPTVLDIGSSYGVNGALLRCGTSVAELTERYAAAASLSRAELVAADRAFVDARRRPDAPRCVGLDVSRPALDYAVAAGFLDGALHADFEADEPTDAQRSELAGTDLVVSTGCLGYVTEKTLLRVVDAAGGRLPWMAHFCLRMFPYDAIAAELGDLGYTTVRIDRPFRQRRFATDHERTSVLDRLSDLGVDATGLEADGWFYAQLYLSRPRNRKAA
ncbi:methyltransferase type 12 [Cryptosporangium aurantiacum]|uniref:Carnitine O-acetyltransferase n=1 Tax=Cryptosporangium aurantiacum TaxID=134849 RepID=A0A1M7RG89_9ACTN|nr:methyltransferase type 12 [Cryptosporangium aurantiacum]SHN45303.1 hypothetical protein SAMN05443668_111243 [Cryptosporangium aurantiacum]